ncbi:F-actin capping protein, beta subunit [Hypoxylon trugodes]|uniref:F-actin capping protein, beta subunit n=1 Tax=Hypoxylon trugodes TaxID=326681 RepID=UPI0021A0C06B|nr:F-actin capping protein, beta subunit [Hypoxylon trugodes]KAI1390087.1 F-actin capping protein, beta subunit [Hypoxylon trugodes]
MFPLQHLSRLGSVSSSTTTTTPDSLVECVRYLWNYHIADIIDEVVTIAQPSQPEPVTNTMSADPFDSALDLLRRLNPKHTSAHLDSLIRLAPDLTEDLLSSVDQPLSVRRCKQTGRDYLLCDYNRDGDSYRSPWSNEFDPPLDSAPSLPSEKVRRMEVRANEAFDLYRDLYYEGGVSSVYFWNLDDGFAGVVLLKKEAKPGSASEGTWDSIHVFEAIDRARFTQYNLTSTVILSLSTNSNSLGDMDLSGNMTRQIEIELPAESDEQQIANIGKLVEDMELKMRNLLQEVYFGKAKDVVGDLRSVGSLSEGARDKEAQKELIGSMMR